ncbi:hypothetical protein D3C73_1620160 [compost metagenome]
MRFAESLAAGPALKGFFGFPACADRDLVILGRLLIQQYFKAQEAFHLFDLADFVEPVNQQ